MIITDDIYEAVYNMVKLAILAMVKRFCAMVEAAPQRPDVWEFVEYLVDTDKHVKETLATLSQHRHKWRTSESQSTTEDHCLNLVRFAEPLITAFKLKYCRFVSELYAGQTPAIITMPRAGQCEISPSRMTQHLQSNLAKNRGSQNRYRIPAHYFQRVSSNRFKCIALSLIIFVIHCEQGHPQNLCRIMLSATDWAYIGKVISMQQSQYMSDYDDIEDALFEKLDLIGTMKLYILPERNHANEAVSTFASFETNLIGIAQQILPAADNTEFMDDCEEQLPPLYTILGLPIEYMLYAFVKQIISHTDEHWILEADITNIWTNENKTQFAKDILDGEIDKWYKNVRSVTQQPCKSHNLTTVAEFARKQIMNYFVEYLWLEIPADIRRSLQPYGSLTVIDVQVLHVLLNFYLKTIEKLVESKLSTFEDGRSMKDVCENEVIELKLFAIEFLNDLIMMVNSLLLKSSTVKSLWNLHAEGNLCKHGNTIDENMRLRYEAVVRHFTEEKPKIAALKFDLFGKDFNLAVDATKYSLPAETHQHMNGQIERLMAEAKHLVNIGIFNNCFVSKCLFFFYAR